MSVLCSWTSARRLIKCHMHSLLLQELESLNINLHLLNWIQDYLCNRSQYVVVNGESSTSAPVVSGVPQGSMLGPLFFLIYINDIMEVCLSDGCMLLYADDILTSSVDLKCE